MKTLALTVIAPSFPDTEIVADVARAMPELINIIRIEKTARNETLRICIIGILFLLSIKTIVLIKG